MPWSVAFAGMCSAITIASYFHRASPINLSCFLNAYNPLECDICSNEFSDDRCPRILPCSHTLCGCCIDKLISSQTKACPVCKRAFTAVSAEDLLLNRNLLDAAKHKGAKPSRGSVSSFEEFINGFRVNFTQKRIADYEETETLVLDALEILKGMKADALENHRGAEGLTHMLQKLKLLNKKTLSKIDQNSKLLTGRLNVIRHKKAKIKKSDDELKETKGFSAAGVVMDESKGILNEAPEEIQEIKALLQKNEREKEDIIKESLSTKIRLENVSVELGRIEDESSVNITLEYLMKMSSRRAFLDLSVDGTHLGRIIIKVMDEGNLALNFLHLCAGDLGTSYANSQVLGVDCKDEDGENVDMGYYNMLLSGVDLGEEMEREIYEEKSWKAGDVGVYEGDTTLLFIVTRDNFINDGCHHLGTVEEGLEVLQDAILRYRDIQKIKIVECGLISSL
ncbi:E3 ubiquitin-protein ligase trim-21-like isoform X3 [Macrobrachium rosenbergii]|uniref:E3 ubiquitin-protein ligase trim-21-like isoform X3 n=1 Tax=Macrobrachium rosenbergii TaxID=79674 RepID=UPI0034D6DBB6